MDSSLIGISGYITDTPGFKGKIKQDPESFIVEEIPVNIKEDNSGKYTIMKIKLYNWDTNKFLIRLANTLHISNKRITYAGTKDRTGITTQYFCINMPDGMETGKVNIRDAEIISMFKSNTIIRLGDLLGNRFTVAIESDYDNSDMINETFNEIIKLHGFPNFFGYQRFGSIRANTHKIGKLLLQDKYDDAVKLYLYDPQFDKEDYRIHFGDTLDAATALKEYPEYLTFERALLNYIIKEKKYDGAFDVFPKNLSMLFIHAYQSYLFNMMLSARTEKNSSMTDILPGDLAYPVDEYSNSDKREIISASKYNIEKLNELSIKNKIKAVIPLPGFDTKIPCGIQGEIFKDIMEKEDIKTDDFRMQKHRKLGSSGDYRVISAMPVDFKIKDINTIDFSLGRGIYATSLIREFLKNGF